MKAIVYRQYGSPDVLQWEEVEKPAAGKDEVLIKVRAASLNPIDWHFMRGTPYIIRRMTGRGKPKNTGLGADLAGQVEAVGSNVTRFKPGDEVFGACEAFSARRGAFAEYACAPANALALKPANLTFEQAAAVPVAGAFTALQGLRVKGRIHAGQEVLINGASGGVGTFAVQIAKAFGATVTGVCGPRNVEMVRSLGADHVIDYTHEDFTRSGRRWDLIFDCAVCHTVSESRRVLSPHGVYVIVGGSDPGLWIGPMKFLLKGLLMSPFVSQTLSGFFAAAKVEDLMAMKELMETGKVTPVIDRCYPLREVPAAIRYLEEGHARGKVVITVEHGA